MTIRENSTSNLIKAIHAGQISDVITALNEGADIDAPDMHGYRGLPLRTACFEGHLAIVRELLMRGANVNAAASDGPAAPLRLALRKGHQEIIALLLQQGAQIPQGSALPANVTELTLDDAVLSEIPESKPDNNMIEFSHNDSFPALDLLDTPSQFGTETNVLSMDLLFHEEDEANLASPLPKNSL